MLVTLFLFYVPYIATILLNFFKHDNSYLSVDILRAFGCFICISYIYFVFWIGVIV